MQKKGLTLYIIVKLRSISSRPGGGGIPRAGLLVSFSGTENTQREQSVRPSVRQWVRIPVTPHSQLAAPVLVQAELAEKTRHHQRLETDELGPALNQQAN